MRPCVLVPTTLCLVFLDGLFQKVDCLKDTDSFVWIIYPAFFHQLYQLSLPKASFTVSRINVRHFSIYYLFLDNFIIVSVILKSKVKRGGSWSDTNKNSQIMATSYPQEHSIKATLQRLTKFHNPVSIP